MLHRVASLAVLLLWAVLIGPAARAQEPAPAPPPPDPQDTTFSERLDVVEVLLELTVTDHDGNLVLGLEPDDFVIEENGRQAEVTGVSFHSYHAFVGDESELKALKQRGVEPQAVPEGRHFILFFHDLRKTDTETRGVLSQQFRAAHGAQEWVRTELGPRDQVAVLRYDFSLKLYLDFSSDRQAITEAIDRALTRRDPGRVWPSRVKSEGESLARYLPQGEDIVDATTSTYDALLRIAEAAGHVPGRKSLLFFSIGTGLLGQAEHALLDSQYTPTLLETLNANDVAVYALDLTPPNAEHALAGVLQTVADATGGRYFHHVTEFRKPLRRVSEELQGYYLVSFRSSKPAGERGYQGVTVYARDPDLEVQGRKGFIYGRDLPPGP